MLHTGLSERPRGLNYSGRSEAGGLGGTDQVAIYMGL